MLTVYDSLFIVVNYCKKVTTLLHGPNPYWVNFLNAPRTSDNFYCPYHTISGSQGRHTDEVWNIPVWNIPTYCKTSMVVEYMFLYSLYYYYYYSTLSESG